MSRSTHLIIALIMALATLRLAGAPIARARTSTSGQPRSTGTSTSTGKTTKIPSKKNAPVAVPPNQLGIVDGIPIYQEEWDRLAKPYFEEVQARAGRALNDDEQKLLRRNVLDELIRERLWVADAQRRGMKISDAAIDSRMKQSEFFKTNGQIDEAKFAAFKQSPASNYAALHEQVERALLMEEYMRWMERRFGPREAELRKAFEERTTQASIRYFVLGPEAISLEPEATAAQIRAYYEDHPDEFETADEAHLQYIRVGSQTEAGVSDSLREAASVNASKTATEILAAIKAGAPEETAAKPEGGLRDSGWFRIGEPIRGLGRSDALAQAIRTTEPGNWIREPIRIGPYAIVAKVVERRKPRRVSFAEAVPQAKRKADLEMHEEVTDSLARAEVRLHPDAFYAPRVTASLVARGLSSFEAGSPPSSKEVEHRLAQLRKDLNQPASRAWLDSTRDAIPKLITEERRLASAMRTMREVAIRLRKREDPSRVAARQGAALSGFQLYRGEAPTTHLLMEGSTLDSLYALRPGDVLGPRVKDDSIYVVRVEKLDPNFLPPYETVRAAARTAVLERRRDEQAREAELYFREHRENYLTPPRWVIDYVFFRKQKPESVPVSPDSITAYWREHPLEFTEPSRARVRHVLIAFKAGDANARASARQKALAARKRILGGEEFAAVARELSDDPGSAQRGGDLGEITRGTVVKEFGDAAFTVPVGEISDLVETHFGFHILKVEERKPERLRPLEECRDEIQGVLGGDLADSLAHNAAISLLAAVKAGAAFDSVAAKVGVVKRSEPTSSGAELADLGRATWIEKEIGSLADGAITPEPIALPEGYLVAKRVREMKPERATFDEVRERAIMDAQRERRRAVADSLDARFREAIRSGADPESLFVVYGGLRVSKQFGREGPIPDLTRDLSLGRDSTYLSRIFAAKPGTVLPPLKGSSGTLYAVVDAVSTLPPTEFAKQRDTLLRELVDQRVEAWTDRLRSKAPIRLLRKDLLSLQG